MAKEIIFEKKQPNKDTAKFIEKTWLHGLGELAFENKISLKKHIQIPYQNTVDTAVNHINLSHKCLVPLGGGKDSLVTGRRNEKTG